MPWLCVILNYVISVVFLNKQHIGCRPQPPLHSYELHSIIPRLHLLASLLATPTQLGDFIPPSLTWIDTLIVILKETMMNSWSLPRIRSSTRRLVGWVIGAKKFGKRNVGKTEIGRPWRTLIENVKQLKQEEFSEKKWELQPKIEGIGERYGKVQPRKGKMAQLTIRFTPKGKKVQNSVSNKIIWSQIAPELPFFLLSIFCTRFNESILSCYIPIQTSGAVLICL